MRPFLARALLAALASIPLLLGVSDAGAVGTRTFVLDSLERLSGGDLKGVSVDADGTVRAGLTLGSAPLGDAQASFSALSLRDGSVLVGTSPGGKVYKVTGDAAQVFAETGTLAVTALAELKDGSIVAATIPDGKLFKLGQGKATPFATLPQTSHAWALATDRNGVLYAAAGGPEGKIFRVDASGQVSVYFKSEEPHLVAVAMGRNSEVYAGSSGKGLLYKIMGPGRAEVLYDFVGEEVKAIAVAADGTVFAISNEYGEPPEPPRRTVSGAGRNAPGPTSGARPKPGRGSLYRFDTRGRPEKLMGHSEFHYLALALDEHGRPHVGTGAEGRVYTVDDSHAVSLEADTDQRQVGALALANGRGYVASSDPPVLHRVLGQGGAEAIWTSKVLDTSLRARFGRLGWQATGHLEFSTRTGNTQTPDGTWSGWSAPLQAPGGVTSPAGRYVQVRARFTDPRAALSEVTLPFVTENARPVILDVSAGLKGAPTKEPRDGIPASGGEPPKRDSIVKVTWRVENIDADPLRYRLSYRRDGQPVSRELTRQDELLTKTEYEWDTQALPEGKYRVRVEASDELANPPREVQRHAKESDPVLIDNTPPVLAEVALTGRRLRARASDGVSPIARIELAVDGRNEFRPLASTDGVMDSLSESVDDDVSTLVPSGNHLVTVRAYDAAGNQVSRDIEAR